MTAKHQTRKLSNNCDICKKAFYTEKQVEGHISRCHSEQKSFECENCAKSFSIAQKLESHVLSCFKAPKSNKCSVCNASFYSKNRLAQHEKYNHENNQRSRKLQDKKINLKTLKCDLCDEMYHRQYLKTHINIVHNEKNEQI